MRRAFSGESGVAARLLITTAVVETRDANVVGGELRRLPRPSQRRVHMAKESSARHRQLTALLQGLPIDCSAVATVVQRTIDADREGAGHRRLGHHVDLQAGRVLVTPVSGAGAGAPA